MSPLPRAGRKATAALAVALVFTMGFLAAIGTPVGAQEGNATGDGGNAAPGAGGDAGTSEPPAEGKIARTLTIGVIDAGCPGGLDPCWDTNILVAQPGDRIVLIADMRNSANTHNLHVVEPIGEKTQATSNELHRVEFTMPETVPAGGLEYVCDVHLTSMVGVLVTPAMAATMGASGAGEEVVEMGVHFLAYWVGVIAFAILFVVYGITFFLFKYNETSATTDHWDRSGTAPASKLKGGVASLLAVVIAVAALAGIIYVARFG